MNEINFEELSQIKILPFDIKDDTGDKLIKAGEILTPGKLLSLKNKKIYKTSPIEKSKNEVIINEDYFIISNNDKKRMINSFLILIEHFSFPRAPFSAVQSLKRKFLTRIQIHSI